eukprot:TRINITY_DN10365_c0_g1_i4.p1 TRINITY_DN10365_c0_g1~~TRINITY_DN10365_c0_g1_i4.p1  ORF type:complete len:766 (+),score=99.55 TRINITY_DN10365_c0_g1_i4:114-2411(+)
MNPMKRWGSLRQQLRRLDFRFTSENEAEFKLSLRPQVCYRLGAACICYIPICLASFWLNFPKQAYRQDFPFAWSSGDPRTVFFVAHMVFFALDLLVLLLFWLQTKVLKEKWWDWELMAVVSCVLGSLVVILSNRELGWGQDPEEVWGAYPYGSKSSVALILDVNVTAMCVFIPVSFTSLWVGLLGAWVSYTVSVLFFGTFLVELTEIMILGMLFVLAFIGSCYKEKVLRDRWFNNRKLKETWQIMINQQVEIQEGQAMAQGLQTVAEALCDLIVKVNDDLKISDDAETALNAFFERSVAGVFFPDLLCEEDRRRFNLLMDSATNSSCPACMPFTLKKKSSVTEVHMLLVDTKCVQPRYLVGIRVQKDTPTTLGTPMFMHQQDTSFSLATNKTIDELSAFSSFDGDGTAAGGLVGWRKHAERLQGLQDTSPRHAQNSFLDYSFSTATFHSEIRQSSSFQLKQPNSMPPGSECRANNSIPGQATDDDCISVMSIEAVQASASPPPLPKITVKTAFRQQTTDAFTQTVATAARPPQAAVPRRSAEFVASLLRKRPSSSSRKKGRSVSKDLCTQPLLGEFHITSLSAIEFQIGHLCRLINWEVDNRGCCPWHSVLGSLAEAAGQLQQKTDCHNKDRLHLPPAVCSGSSQLLPSGLRGCEKTPDPRREEAPAGHREEEGGHAGHPRRPAGGRVQVGGHLHRRLPGPGQDAHERHRWYDQTRHAEVLSPGHRQAIFRHGRYAEGQACAWCIEAVQAPEGPGDVVGADAVRP